MSIKKFKKTKGYESLKREFLQNNHLSLEARGLLSYMESMPDNYVFHKTQLYKTFDKNKKTSVERIWNELLDEGYIFALSRRNEFGQLEYEYLFTHEGFSENDLEEIGKTYFVDGWKTAYKSGTNRKPRKKQSEEAVSPPPKVDSKSENEPEKEEEDCSIDDASSEEKPRESSDSKGVENQQRVTHSGESTDIKSISKGLSINKKSDTYRYQKSASQHSVENSFDEIPVGELIRSERYPFLTEKTVERLSLFQDFELIDKIYQAKAAVEKHYKTALLAKAASDDLRDLIPSDRQPGQLDGELWAAFLEQVAKKFVVKYKRELEKGKPINDIRGYFYVTMKTFWEKAMMLELEDSQALIFTDYEWVVDYFALPIQKEWLQRRISTRIALTTGQRTQATIIDVKLYDVQGELPIRGSREA